MITMTTTRAGDLEPAIAAARESIEAEIAGSTLLTAFAETTGRHGGTEAYRWRQDGQWRTLTYAGLRGQVREAAQPRSSAPRPKQRQHFDVIEVGDSEQPYRSGHGTVTAPAASKWHGSREAR